MPTPNIPHVQTANTFDFWRIQTNNLINVANELRSTTYEKEGGLLYLSNTAIGTAFQVSGNARVDNTLTVGTLLATTANISGNLTTSNATITDTLTAARANITGNLSAGNVSVSGALTLSGVNIAQAIANSANTARVSANSGSTISAAQLNFVNTSTLTVSVTSGPSGNANVEFTVIGGGGGGSGAQGPQGVQGATGSPGAQGVQGATGSPGAQGVQGATGSPGAQGVQGATGSPGAQGAQGAQGRQGVQGAIGPSNAVNATNDTSSNPLYPVLVATDGSNQTPKVSKTKLSFNANDGTLSATKFSGDGSLITGITGTPGAQGVQGAPGAQGAIGVGSPGAQGAAGSPGAQGAAGSPGAQGAQGASGLSGGSTTNLELKSLGVGTAASGVQGEIRATNDITAYYSSDVRLKENIRKIENALELISMIEGVRYDWTDEYIEKRGGIDDYFVRKEDIGVIAQDLQKVLPEVVAERPDGYLAVRYEKIVALLLAALKELKQEVDDLKSRL